MSRSGILSRRTFLGGGSVLVGLPLLEAMIPHETHAGPASGPQRILVFYTPNGIGEMNLWVPSNVGSGFTLSTLLQPLAKIQSKVLVLSGLNNRPGSPDAMTAHLPATAAILSCRAAQKDTIKCGISMDQVAAAKLGIGTRIPSLQLGDDAGVGLDYTQNGYAGAYGMNISWASATQALPKTVDPQVLFDRLFPVANPKAGDAAAVRRATNRTSVLDYVTDDSKRLSARLGRTDRAKLDEYLTAVSALEKRLQVPQVSAASSCPLPVPLPSSFSYEEMVHIMLDLMVLAFQCDATRVITYMHGFGFEEMVYSFIGAHGAHHALSHQTNDPEARKNLQLIDTWEVAQFAYLLEKMDAISEGGTTMLDNTLALFVNEHSDGNTHSVKNMPIILAGRGGGAFKSGRHIAFNGDPLANLYISILNAVGVGVTAFGDDGTAPLPGLT